MKHSILFIICALACMTLSAQNKPKGNTQSSLTTSLQPKLSCAQYDANVHYYENKVLSEVISSAITVLVNLPTDAYYDSPSQKADLLQMLRTPHLSFSEQELQNLKCVKSIQISTMGIFEYSYFKCSFTQKGSTVYYRKTTGSQRQNGNLYRVNEKTLYFLGAWSVNDDPIKDYNSDQAVIGAMYKLASEKYIMIIPEGNDMYNILLFK